MKNLAIAYAVKQRNAKKMAKGGMVKDEVLPLMHDTEAMQNDFFKGMDRDDESVEGETEIAIGDPIHPFAKKISTMAQGAHMAHGGMMMSPKAMVHQMLKAKEYADGGEVKKEPPKQYGYNPAAGPSPKPEEENKISFDEDKAKLLAKGFLKATHYAKGGMVTDPDFVSDEEDDSPQVLDDEILKMDEMDNKMKRKGIMDRIMRGLSDKHMGKT